MHRIKKIQMFTEALLKFITRSKGRFLDMDKILIRFEICKNCDHFTGRNCLVCGCGISGRKSLLNKLAMPTEKCPNGKWINLL